MILSFLRAGQNKLNYTEVPKNCIELENNLYKLH